MEGRPDGSVGELLGTLARDTSALMRQELQLASTEMTLKARRAARNAGLVAFGGALALAGFLALLSAAVAALGLVLPVWLAALIVGVVVTGAGCAVLARGLTALRHIDPIPGRTLGTLSDDVAWAKEQVR